MATYKKQLKDQNGDNIIPALGTATVTSTNIDWSTMVVYTKLQASISVAAYTTVLSLTLPAGKWKVTTEVGGSLSLSQNASGGFTHCGLKTTICMVQVGGYIRPHETFVDIVEPTAQTTYTLQADFGMTYTTETKIIAERIG